MAEKISFHLNMSLHRAFLFLFFMCAYTFLNFWIATTLFLSIGIFAIFGIVMYVFVSVFHLALIRIGARDELAPDQKKAFESKYAFFFFAFLILVSLAYLAGVYWMQGLVVHYLKVPGEMYNAVGLALGIFSLGLSFMLSFIRRS